MESFAPFVPPPVLRRTGEMAGVLIEYVCTDSCNYRVLFPSHVQQVRHEHADGVMYQMCPVKTVGFIGSVFPAFDPLRHLKEPPHA